METINKTSVYSWGFPGGASGREHVCQCRKGNAGSVSGRGRLSGGNGNPLQYSCLENPTDRGAWWATVHRVAKSRTRLSDFTFYFRDTQITEDTLTTYTPFKLPGEEGGCIR